MGKFLVVLLLAAFACITLGFKIKDVDGAIESSSDIKAVESPMDEPIDAADDLEEPIQFDDDLEFDGEEEDPNEEDVEDINSPGSIDSSDLGDNGGDSHGSLMDGKDDEVSADGLNRRYYHRYYRRRRRYSHRRHHNHYSLTCKSGALVGGSIRTGHPIYRNIYFRPYFKRTPAIVIGVKRLGSFHYNNVRFGVRVVFKNRTHMRLKLYTWGKHSGVYQLYVNWMACPR